MARRQSNYPSNNRMTDRPPVQPVITGTVTTGGKSNMLASKVRDIGNGLFSDIIIPAIKSTIVDFIESGIRMALFGDERGMSTRGGQPRAYHNMHNRRAVTSRYRRAQPPRTISNIEPIFDDLFYQNRDDAHHVLGRMIERIAEYGWATYGDLYTFSNLTPSPVLEKWGWDNLSGTTVIRTADGFIIGLPEPMNF